MAEGEHTGWYVYGVVRTPGPPLPDLAGMDGHGLEVLEHAGTGAVVSRIVLPRPPGRRRDLVSHHDVLNAIAAEQDVVPLRLGTVVEDQEALVDELLRARIDVLTDQLDRVRDAVQLNLRISYVQERVLAEILAEDPGLRALHERTRGLPPGASHPDLLTLGRLMSDRVMMERRRDSHVVRQTVLPLVIDTRERDRNDVDHVLDLALLVDRRTVTSVEDALEHLAQEVHARMRVQLVGPMAPYDFAGEPSWA